MDYLRRLQTIRFVDLIYNSNSCKINCEENMNYHQKFRNKETPQKYPDIRNSNISKVARKYDNYTESNKNQNIHKRSDLVSRNKVPESRDGVKDNSLKSVRIACNKAKISKTPALYRIESSDITKLSSQSDSTLTIKDHQPLRYRSLNSLKRRFTRKKRNRSKSSSKTLKSSISMNRQPAHIDIPRNKLNYLNTGKNTVTLFKTSRPMDSRASSTNKLMAPDYRKNLCTNEPVTQMSFLQKVASKFPWRKTVCPACLIVNTCSQNKENSVTDNPSHTRYPLIDFPKRHEKKLCTKHSSQLSQKIKEDDYREQYIFDNTRLQVKNIRGQNKKNVSKQCSMRLFQKCSDDESEDKHVSFTDLPEKDVPSRTTRKPSDGFETPLNRRPLKEKKENKQMTVSYNLKSSSSKEKTNCPRKFYLIPVRRLKNRKNVSVNTDLVKKNSSIGKENKVKNIGQDFEFENNLDASSTDSSSKNPPKYYNEKHCPKNLTRYYQNTLGYENVSQPVSVSNNLQPTNQNKTNSLLPCIDYKTNNGHGYISPNSNNKNCYTHTSDQKIVEDKINQNKHSCPYRVSDKNISARQSFIICSEHQSNNHKSLKRNELDPVHCLAKSSLEMSRRNVNSRHLLCPMCLMENRHMIFASKQSVKQKNEKLETLKTSTDKYMDAMSSNKSQIAKMKSFKEASVFTSSACVDNAINTSNKQINTYEFKYPTLPNNVPTKTKTQDSEVNPITQVQDTGVSPMFPEMSPSAIGGTDTKKIDNLPDHTNEVSMFTKSPSVKFPVECSTRMKNTPASCRCIFDTSNCNVNSNCLKSKILGRCFDEGINTSKYQCQCGNENKTIKPSCCKRSKTKQYFRKKCTPTQFKSPVCSEIKCHLQQTPTCRNDYPLTIPIASTMVKNMNSLFGFFTNDSRSGRQIVKQIIFTILLLTWCPCIMLVWCGWCFSSPFIPSHLLRARNRQCTRTIPTQCDTRVPRRNNRDTCTLSTLWSNFFQDMKHMSKSIISTKRSKSRMKRKRSFLPRSLNRVINNPCRQESFVACRATLKRKPVKPVRSHRRTPKYNRRIVQNYHFKTILDRNLRSSSCTSNNVLTFPLECPIKIASSNFKLWKPLSNKRFIPQNNLKDFSQYILQDNPQIRNIVLDECSAEKNESRCEKCCKKISKKHFENMQRRKKPQEIRPRMRCTQLVYNIDSGESPGTDIPIKHADNFHNVKCTKCNRQKRISGPNIITRSKCTQPRPNVRSNLKCCSNQRPIPPETISSSPCSKKNRLEPQRNTQDIKLRTESLVSIPTCSKQILLQPKHSRLLCPCHSKLSLIKYIIENSKQFGSRSKRTNSKCAGFKTCSPCGKILRLPKCCVNKCKKSDPLPKKRKKIHRKKVVHNRFFNPKYFRDFMKTFRRNLKSFKKISFQIIYSIFGCVIDGAKKADRDAWKVDVTSCEKLYMYSLRDRPCFWFFRYFPKCYPSFLSLRKSFSRYSKCCSFTCAFCMWSPFLTICFICVRVFQMCVN